MANGQFQKGDLVTLKSGSVEMTVEAVVPLTGGKEFQVHTVWFDNGSFSRFSFVAEALIHAADGEDEADFSL